MPADSPDIRYDVFISYARKDGADYAARLQRDLEAIGLRVWRDITGIEPSNNFIFEIQRAILASRFCVLCVTSDVLRENSFVHNEVAYSDYHKKPILVARFEDVEPPLNVFARTWIDFFLDRDTAFKRLRRALEERSISSDRTIEPSVHDPFGKYVKWLYELAVEEIERAILTTDVLALRTVESPADVPQRPRRLETRFVTYSIKDAEPLERPSTPFTSLNAAYASADCAGRVLLLGEPGAGKTMTLLAFARDAAAARLSDPSQPLPVFARIAGWDSLNQTPLHDWLAAMYPDMKDPALQSLIEQGRALLLLDGLDELGSRRPLDPNDLTKGDYDPRERFLKALPPKGKLILSSRVEEYRDIHQQAALNCAVRLEPLDDAQMQAYLADVPDLWQVIAADASLKDALRTPLLLALVRVGFEDVPEEVRALRDLNAGDLSDRIWNAFIDKRWAHEQARQPDVPLAYTAEELKERLGIAAMRAMSDGLREDDTRILTRDVWDDHFGTLIPLARSLDLLQPAGDVKIIIDTHPSFQFLHLRLRDAVAFPVVLTALSDLDEGVRTNAAWLLGKLGDSRAVNALITALEDTDEGVRMITAYSLGELGDPRAVKALISAQNNSNGLVRIRVLEALARLGEPTIDKIIASLNDSAANARETAADVLGKLGDARAVEPLIASLYDPDDNVRYAAAWALGELRDPRAIQPLIAALKISSASDALAKMGTSALEPLVAALRDGQVDYYSAYQTLARMGKPALEPLSAALRDPNVDIRYSVVHALEAMGELAVELLITTLRDPDWNVRVRAADALSKFGDPRATQPLIMALHDPVWEVRHSAVDALGESGDSRAVEPLIAAFRDSDLNVRGRAAMALKKLGKSAVEPLIAALQDSDWHVRNRAIGVLGESGDARAVEPLIAALHDSEWGVCRTVVEALSELGDARAVEPLIVVLVNREAGVHEWAAKALGKFSDLRAVEPLIGALFDPDLSVRGRAAEALGRLGDARAVEPLIAAWHDPENYVRRSIAEALGVLGDGRAVELLIDGLNDPDRDVRRITMDALGKLGDIRAVEPLIAALLNSDVWDQPSAVYALESFKDHPAAQQALADYHAGKLPPRTE